MVISDECFFSAYVMSCSLVEIYQTGGSPISSPLFAMKINVV